MEKVNEKAKEIVGLFDELLNFKGIKDVSFEELDYLKGKVESELIELLNENDSHRLTQEEVEKLRKVYPSGTKLMCLKMNDPQPIECGEIGIVKSIDDAGQIHMNWKNGRSLALVPYVDKFKAVK